MTRTVSTIAILAATFALLSASDRAAGHAISTRFIYESQAPVSIFNEAPPEASFDESVDWRLPNFAYDIIPTGVSFTLGSTGTGGVRGAIGLSDSLLSYSYRPQVTTFVLPAGASRPGAFRFGSSVSVTGGQSGFSTTSVDPYAHVDAYLNASYDVSAQYCFFNLCTSDAAKGSVDDSWRLFGYRSNSAASTIEITLLDQVLPSLPSGASYEVLSGGCIKTIESLCTVGSEVGSGTLYAPDTATTGVLDSATTMKASVSGALMKLELDVDGIISALVGVPLTGIAVDIADVLSLSADAVDVDLVGSLKLTRAQSMAFTLGNVYSFDQTVSIETSRGVRYAKAGEDLLLPVAQEFVVTPLVAGAVPHVSVSPYLRGTFTDSIGLSLCGGIEVDVLKASAGIVGLGEWSIGPLYAAEAELGCYEIARLSDTTYRLPDMVADAIDVLSLGAEVTLAARALRAPGFELPPDDGLAAVPAPASALLLATGLLSLGRRRKKS